MPRSCAICITEERVIPGSTELPVGGDFGGFGDSQVDAIGQGFAQGRGSVGGRGLAQAVQGFDFLFHETMRHDSRIAANLPPFPAGVHPIFGPQEGQR